VTPLGVHVRRFAALLTLACTAEMAAAHLVPIPPSLCAFDPLTLAAPASGTTGTAQPATDADTNRILFDPGESRIQVCAAAPDPTRCGAAVPRAFTLGSVTGTLAFPALFPGRMLSTGDVVVDDVPVTLAVGSDVRTVGMRFTTALTASGGAILEGIPLQGLASLTLVGVADPVGLPSALSGGPLVVTMSCLPRPVPDIGQFDPPPALSSIGGQLGRRSRLRWTVDLITKTPVDFGAHPTLLAIHVDGQTVHSAVFSSGLTGSRQLTGTSDDGQDVLTVRQGRTPSSGTHFTVSAHLPNVDLSPQAAGSPALVDVTLDMGGLLERGEQLFHVASDGRTLRAR
jgi:hypothetical protein